MDISYASNWTGRTFSKEGNDWDSIDIAEEFYVAITLDRSSGKDVLWFHPKVEWKSKKLQRHHQKNYREKVTPGLVLLDFKVGG